ncbi:MAG: hypothetical protein PHG08_03765 [Bacilli bacterium]|nr:hypothetical protein [Bacilli bacterium]
MSKHRFQLFCRLSLALTVLFTFVFTTPLKAYAQSRGLSILNQYQLVEIDNDDGEYLKQYGRLQTQLNKFHLIGLFKVTEPGDEETFSLNIPAIYQQRKSLRLWYLSLESDENESVIEKVNEVTILETEITFKPKQPGYYALVDLKAVSISIYKEPDKMAFSANETRDFSGMIIEAQLEDDTSYLTDDFTVGDTELTDIFHDEVEIIYENCVTHLVIGVGPIACGCFTGVYQRALSLVVIGLLAIMLIRRK